MAAKAVTALGDIETALPLRSVPVRRTHQPWVNGVRLTPCFPSYLLMRFDIAVAPWREIHRQPGVQGLLGASGEAPTPARPGAIEAALEHLRMLEADPAAPTAAYPMLEPGDTVCVIDGPWAGFVGDVTRSTEERVWWLMTVFGRTSEVNIPRRMVEKAA
jgi:transcription antitermination factor NusG